MELQLFLQDWIKEIESCRLCPDFAETTPVPVSGAGECSENGILLIGEALGAEEVVQRCPFIGRSGQLLRRTMREFGINDQRVFITNICHCRPPENRPPKKTEIDNCKKFKVALFKAMKPKLIVGLGSTPMKFLLGKHASITSSRGKLYKPFGIWVMTIFHPAYVLRGQGLNEFRKDISNLGKIFNGSEVETVREELLMEN